MKTYHIYIKSHTEAPDYEDFVEAETKDKAVDYFMSKLGAYGWGRREVEEEVEEELE